MSLNNYRIINATGITMVYLFALTHHTYAARLGPSVLGKVLERDLRAINSSELLIKPFQNVSRDSSSTGSKSSNVAANKILWYGVGGIIGACLLICIPAHIVAENRSSKAYYVEGGLWLSILAAGVTYQTISAKFEDRSPPTSFYITAILFLGTFSAASFIQGAMNDNYLIQSNNNYKDLFYSNIGTNILLLGAAVGAIFLTAWLLDVFDVGAKLSDSKYRVHLFTTGRQDTYVFGVTTSF